ncbi:transmembrane protein, putative (macronuclear) [Tetrahymena thermophila SB210]|uniref:Transmembrane protein, putative n=1 Tax=Tetrahymena thermophila (strain SB210) TaxID=312017 RepID=W7X316_TETTS|nr:transmembrane protein, putative [Tetrahymena thermophila SB210]EWS71837.1 transmembrane protein, putative [Tetrahymena thermophila SB210]|eukprot:XP_012655630.1 transmembrane protein, putative [Tetrahymena thermophila SB210]
MNFVKFHYSQSNIDISLFKYTLLISNIFNFNLSFLIITPNMLKEDCIVLITFIYICIKPKRNILPNFTKIKLIYISQVLVFSLLLILLFIELIQFQLILIQILLILIVQICYFLLVSQYFIWFLWFNCIKSQLKVNLF